MILHTSLAAQSHSDNNKDQSIRGTSRVNQSSLGLEISIPLGEYPGRGIDIPISISYSSKLWRTEFITSQSRLNNPGDCIQINVLQYAERSASGWTSSLGVPYIEYTGADNLYNERGFALSDECTDTSTGAPPVLDNAYVKRITVHLPSGESHELRSSDDINTYPMTGQPSFDFNGTFYAVDGSNLKYHEDAASGRFELLLPDGSNYKFKTSKEFLSGEETSLVRKASVYADKNGNTTSYNSSNGVLTDTLGRNFAAPLGFEAPSTPTTSENPNVYSLPGIGGGHIQYMFHWKRLNGGSQAESALTDITDPAYALKYKSDRATTDPLEAPRPAGTYLFSSEYNAWVHDGNDGLFNPVVLTKIELPTGGSYNFSYDNFGRIENIEYPTGAVEKLQYQQIPSLSVTAADDISNQTNYGVVQRKLYENPANGAPYVWNYSAQHVAPGGYKVTTVSPEGIKSERLLHRGNDPDPDSPVGNFGFDDERAGMIFKELIFDKNNSLVNKTVSSWAVMQRPVGNAPGGVQAAHWHPRLVNVEKFVYDPATGAGLKALTGYEYEGPVDSMTSPLLLKRTYEYAFQTAANANESETFGLAPDPDPEPSPPNTPPASELLRVNQSTYLINDIEIPEQVRQQYRDRNLILLKTSSELRNGSMNLVSRTAVGYDESGYRAGSAIGNDTSQSIWDSELGAPDNSENYVVTRRKYDQYGNVIEHTDGRGEKSQTEFDSVYNAFPIRTISSIPDPGGSTGSSVAFEETTVFDTATGLPTSKTNINGIETRIQYDAATLRFKKSSQYFNGSPVGAQNEMIYVDEPQNMSIKTRSQIDAVNWIETVTYLDGLGRVMRAEESDDGGNIFIDKKFDSNGRVSSVSNPYRQGETPLWTTMEYDDAGRQTKSIGPDGSTVRVDFGVLVSDRKGTSKTITDQSGRKRQGIADAFGRMTAVVEDPDGESLITEYKFDASNNVREIKQGVQRRFFCYDSLGRVLFSKQPEQDANPEFQRIDPISGNSQWSLRYKYDSNGNMTSSTDARNVTTNSEFDGLNRLVERTFSDGTAAVSYYYDGTGLPNAPQFSKGNVTKVSSNVTEIRNTSFNWNGKVTGHEQRTAGRTFSTAYEYNLSGTLTAEVYPSGRRMEQKLDSNGRVMKVLGTKPGVANPKTYLDQIQRNAAGMTTASRLGNGRWESTRYNDRLQTVGIGLGYSNDEKGLIDIEMGYGTSSENNGSLRSQSISFNGLTADIDQTYQYDSLNRLKSVAESNGSSDSWEETFNYDRFGNREFDTSGTDTLSLFDKTTNPSISSASNRMSSDQDGDARADYVYDKAGNLTRDAENKRYEFDADNRIKKYFKGSNPSSEPDVVYEYDGAGNRVRKVGVSKQTVFVYNTFGKLIAEYSDSLPESPQINYIMKDHLGSTRVVTDGAGSVVTRLDYMAFGEELTSKVGNINGRSESQGYRGNGSVRKLYTGYERDEESGLDFAQARYYSSNHGRFTSVDPLTASANLKNPQTFNRYSYVLNSPYKFVDPLGLISQSTGACAQSCSNVVGGGFEGGTEFDRVARGARSGENFPKKPKAKDGNDEDKKDDGIKAPQSLIAEATERMTSVTVTGGNQPPQDGIIQQTVESDQITQEALNGAFARGVEVGAAAKASQGVVIVTSVTQGTSADEAVTSSLSSTGPTTSLQKKAGSSVSISQENAGAAVIRMDIDARAENEVQASRAAGKLQNTLVNVTTASGTVTATAEYGYYKKSFSRELDLMYRRGVRMGYAGASSKPGAVDNIVIKPKQ